MTRLAAKPHLLCAVLGVAMAVSTHVVFAEQSRDSLLLYASFDRGVSADVARGEPRGLFNGTQYGLKWDQAEQSHADPLLKLAPGLRGKGLLTGLNGQVVYYQAKGNINPAAWTITFWAKALERKDYLRRDLGHMQMFEVQGGGWTRFYKYDQRNCLWVLVTRPGPDKQRVVQTLNLTKQFDVEKWRFFAISFAKETGISMYLDGKLAARDASMTPSMEPQWIRVGQSFGGDKEANRVIDEFKVYGATLTEPDVAQRYLREGRLRTRQNIRVSRTERNIKIDGRLDAEEWADAAGICGFIDRDGATVADTQTRALLTYDDEYLYLAFHSNIPQEAKEMPETRLLHGILKSATLEHDANVDHDDCFGVHIIPRYPKGSLYRLYVNGIETTYEFSISPNREICLKWDPKWDLKSRVSMEGWIVESRIPLSAFGVESIQPGEEWRFQFLRNWQLLKQATDVWEYCAGPRDERGHGLGTVTFAGRDNVAARVEELGGFAQERLTVRAELHNTGAADTSVRATLSASDRVLADEQLDLDAGDAKRFTAQADLRKVDAHLLRLDVAGADGTSFYSQTVPFYLPQPLALALKTYPSAQLITVSWQLRKTQKRAEDLNALVQIVHKRDGSTAKTHHISPLPSLFGVVEIDVARVPTGSYEVKMTIQEGDQALLSKVESYEKQALPEWYGNDLGISDRVLDPWTPLEVDEDAVSMWGRTYDFDGKLLPVRIVNQERQILARPMTCRVVSSTGRGDSASSGCEVQWVKRAPAIVQFARTQRLAGLEVSNSSYIEFDGFTWMELRIAPTGEVAAVEEITLCIPMKKEYAHLINAYDYSLGKTGELPADGHRSAMGPRWVGDEEGGIQVFAEHSSNWVVEDKRRELTVGNGEREVVIELHLVSKRFELKKPRTFALGFIVTPVKPTVPHMRDILSMSSRTVPLVKGTGDVGQYVKRAFQAHSGLKVYHLWSQGWWQTAGLAKVNPDRTAFYPIPRDELPSDYGEIRTNYGATVLQAPYARLRETWAGSPEFDQFKYEWLPNIKEVYIPNESIPKPTRRVQVCQNCASYRDFWLWGLNQLLERSKARALYFDVSKPHHCNNVHHGCGFMTEAGEPVPTYNIRGTRKLLRRIYTLLRAKHPDGLIFFHMSGQVNMAIWSFADALVDGENTVALLDRKENRGYERVLTLEQFAAEYAAQNNFGPYTVMLPQFSRSGAIRAEEWDALGYQHAEYLLGLIFLHNSQLWYPAYIPTKPTNKLYYAFDKNGLNSDWRFIGYWKQAAAQLPANVKASFYVAPDGRRAFMMMMNLRWEDVTAEVALDPAALGMKRVSLATALYHENAGGRLQDGTIHGMALPAKSFRLFLLE